MFIKITINKNEVYLTPSDIENLNPTFTFLQGRRFSYQPVDGDGFKNISLNSLILAVKNAALKPEQDKNEINDFLKVFKAIKDKGYETPDCQIKQENFLTRIITKIKHFFSKTQRGNLFKELDQAIVGRNLKVIQKAPQGGIIQEKPQENQTSQENLSVKKQQAPQKTTYLEMFPQYQLLNQYIENNDVKGAEKILNDTPDLKSVINVTLYNNGSTYPISILLPTAIAKNHLDMVNLLVKFGANPNENTRIGHPIMFAVKNGLVEMVNLLFKLGAKIDKCEDILFTGSTKEEYFDIVQSLIQNVADLNPEGPESPLAFVASKWDKNPEKAKATLEMMIAKGAKLVPNDKIEIETKIPKASIDFLTNHGITI